MIDGRIELRADDLEFPVTIQDEFSTTDDVPELDGILGQPRAFKALGLGLGIRDAGYNIYVAGASGMGRMSLVEREVRRRADGEKVASDWVYVNNFDHPDSPLAVALEPGQGNRLRRDMEELVSRLREELPKAFRREDFSREKQRLGAQYEREGRELYEQLQKIAQEKNLTVQQRADGQVLLIPVKAGRPMTGEEFEQLANGEKEEISRSQQEVGIKINDMIAQQGEISKRLRNDVKSVERDFAARLIDPMIAELRARYTGEKTASWLGTLRENLLDNLNRFQEHPQQPPQIAALLGAAGGATEDTFSEYQVNVIIDNGHTRGAPVVIEGSPNYKNLFGTIHGLFDRTGRVVTNFTHIKAGSLLRANGGYLVFNLLDALVEPLVWKELKRTIRSGFIEYHMYDPFGVFATSALRPEPIPLSVKIVVIGNPLVYHLLHLYDEDFPEIFKVKADFSPEIDTAEISPDHLARFIRKLSAQDSVLPFDSRAVCELFRAGVRLAGDRGKITAELSRLADIARESSFWAQSESQGVVSRRHVRKALDERVYRSDQVAHRVREFIRNGTLLIDVTGGVVGQANGLSVIQLGDYMFGRPSRLTASVGIGAAGIINIERESKLSGRSFDKAMLILEGYLRNTYATRHTLSLSASIAMEQSYGLIEGDSASVAELVCLLSALARIPLRQDIAVTGSVNQWGQVQAVGAISEKVEGFFDVCREPGLSGKQGVCIPRSNTRNLVLRPDVIDAIRDGGFHIWAVETVDQAMELLGGVPAGELDEENSFHWRVDQRLRAIAEALKESRAPIERDMSAYAVAPPTPADPRPILPGREQYGLGI